MIGLLQIQNLILIASRPAETYATTIFDFFFSFRVWSLTSVFGSTQYGMLSMLGGSLVTTA
jgi:ABC-type phosphate transport system permease subunit